MRTLAVLARGYPLKAISHGERSPYRAALRVFRKLCVVGSVTFLCLITSGFAQQSSTREVVASDKRVKDNSSLIGITHVAPRPDDIPYPGQKIQVRVQLKGTKETQRQLRMLLVRDGRLLDMSSFNAELNEMDLPTYQMSFNAPLAEMTYQFLLYNPDGSVTPSTRYSVRRNCVPNVALADGEVKPEIVGDERLQRLVNESKHLEQDLAGYEQVLSLLNGLHQQLAGDKQ